MSTTDDFEARLLEQIRLTNEQLHEQLTRPAREPTKETTMSGEMIDSTSDARTVNNVMRHSYRVLSDQEKEQMRAVKDAGLQFHELLTSLGDSRELQQARVKVEEAVMWATKHITY